MRSQLHISSRILSRSLIAGAAAILVSGTASAAEMSPNPYVKPDGTWINLSGTVESVRANGFILDYGDGNVVVEMDDGDRDADGYKLAAGDKVSVSGRIDDDFFEATTIEAASVYVENLGTTFFSSALDEEGSAALIADLPAPIAISEMSVYGIVTDVDHDEFTVDAGVRAIRVDTDSMAYDPLDDEGYQKIEVGDSVKVRGDMDSGLFEGRELVADSIIKMNE